jgi:hypothetical protein
MEPSHHVRRFFELLREHCKREWTSQRKGHEQLREDHTSYSREHTMQSREPLELRGERIMQSSECMKLSREYIIYNREYTLLSSVQQKWRDSFMQRSKGLGNSRGGIDRPRLKSNRTNKNLIG